MKTECKHLQINCFYQRVPPSSFRNILYTITIPSAATDEPVHLWIDSNRCFLEHFTTFPVFYLYKIYSKLSVLSVVNSVPTFLEPRPHTDTDAQIYLTIFTNLLLKDTYNNNNFLIVNKSQDKNQ